MSIAGMSPSYLRHKGLFPFSRWGSSYSRAKARRMVPLKRTRSYKGVDKKFMSNYIKVVESKFLDLTASSITPITGTSDVLILNAVGQGDTSITRDGETILITSIQFNMRCTSDANLIKDTVNRLLLVLKKDVRGAAVAVTNLFEQDSCFEMRAIDNSKNLKILKSWTFVQECPYVVAQQRQTNIRYYHKFKKPLRVKYLSSTSSVAGLDRNSLSLVFMTDAGATFLPSWFGQIRIVYKDI